MSSIEKVKLLQPSGRNYIISVGGGGDKLVAATARIIKTGIVFELLIKSIFILIAPKCRVKHNTLLFIGLHVRNEIIIMIHSTRLSETFFFLVTHLDLYRCIVTLFITCLVSALCAGNSNT